jgi:predicted RNA-binding Zn-ribbon protein involved in translation (DUF1610 family)
VSRRHHFHLCDKCKHSNIRCTAGRFDPESQACDAEVELDRKGEKFLCESCADEAVATIRLGRTK